VTIAGPPRCLVWLILFFFQWSCAYDDVHDVHDETGSAGQVSRLVTVSTDPFTRLTVHFCLNGRSANPKTPKMAEPYFRSQIWWQILNLQARILIQFPSNHMSISLSFGYIRVWQTDRERQTNRRTDGRTNADHYYSWPSHCGRPANNLVII